MDERTVTVSEHEAEVEARPRLTASPAVLLLAVGFGLYLFIQVGLILGPIIARPVPPGTTDAYVYIAKAEQLRVCFYQRCPALADLRVQLRQEPKLPGGIARQRALSHQRALLQYHLVHSGLLYALHSAGLSYEFALNSLSVAGAILVACAVAWLLIATFGPGPAGFALVLLAFAVYPGYHGLHWMVPSTIALGFGLLSWAAAVARPRGVAVLLPLLVLLAAWTHPMGRIYGAAALVIYAMHVPWRQPRCWLVVALGVVAVASPVIAGLIVDRPTLGFRGLYEGNGWDLWTGVRKNLTAAWWAVRPWLNERGGAPLLALAVVGVALAGLERRRSIYVLAAVVTGLLAVSLVHVLPRYPGEAFNRLFVPFAIIMTGLAVFAVWRSVALFVAPRDAVRPAGVASALRSMAGLSVRIVALALVAVAVVLSTLGSIVNGSRASLGQARYMTAWGMMPLDEDQPTRILASLPKDARIAYYDELSFFFYASRGGLAYGAVFAPALTGTAGEARYYGADRRVALSVRARDGFYGFFGLRTNRPVVIRTARPIDWSRVRLNLSVRGASPVLAVRLIQDARTPPTVLRLAGAKTGWNSLGLPAGTKGRTLIITRRDTGPLAWIQGVQIAAGAKTAWPWDSGVTIMQWKLPTNIAPVIARLGRTGGGTTDAKTVATHRFRTASLTPPGCRHLGIVADLGATVASKIACGVAPAAAPAAPARKPAKPRRRRRRR
ncbi:MAG: hypothetical protein P8Z76_07350 [Alphaproteobacteria bacterium]